MWSFCLNLKGDFKMSEVKTKAIEYIGKTQFAVLATVGGGVPYLRSIASFANDGFTIYFSTGKTTDKVEQINQNPNVSILFQHEGQVIPSFKNVSVTGTAKIVSCAEGRQKAIELLSARSPRFKERAEKGQLEDTTIFAVEPKTVKALDFSKGMGPAAVEEIVF
jgi:pyridoxamine 5'-phosphate oxidase